MSAWEEKWAKVGLDTCKVTLNYLDDFALLDFVRFYPTPTSKLAEELLSKRGTTVKRTENLTSTQLVLNFDFI